MLLRGYFSRKVARSRLSLCSKIRVVKLLGSWWVYLGLSMEAFSWRYDCGLFHGVELRGLGLRSI